MYEFFNKNFLLNICLTLYDMYDINSALEKGFHQNVCWLIIEIKKDSIR